MPETLTYVPARRPGSFWNRLAFLLLAVAALCVVMAYVLPIHDVACYTSPTGNGPVCVPTGTTSPRFVWFLLGFWPGVAGVVIGVGRWLVRG